MVSGFGGFSCLAAEDEKITIKYMARYIDGGTDPVLQGYYDRLQQYKEEHPNVIIEDLSVNELDTYNSKLKASIAANDFPDVMVNYGNNMAAEWVENGL